MNTDGLTNMKWTHLCGLFDLPVRGGRLFQDLDGKDIIAFRLAGGELRAYDAACPHAGALLRPENEMGGSLVCFLHHWRFNVSTGECIDVPECPLTSYPIQTRGMEILIALDTDSV